MAPTRGAANARTEVRGARAWIANIAVILVGAGLLAIGINGHVHRWSPPPVPPASAGRPPSAARPPPAARPASAAGLARAARLAPLRRSVPVALAIPAIGVSARIIALGLDASHGPAAPPLSTPFVTSWYDHGAAPGQAGPALLLGHVDSAAVGPAVFYRLGDLRRGDRIYVTLRDHQVAVFRVSSVALYSQADFPVRYVYGFTRRPTLRLITCGGTFDPQAHAYLDRIVAFAAFVGQGRTWAGRSVR